MRKNLSFKSGGGLSHTSRIDAVEDKRIWKISDLEGCKNS